MRCRSASIPVDGKWDKLDRRGLCLNDKIVKVKITDTCATCATLVLAPAPAAVTACPWRWQRSHVAAHMEGCCLLAGSWTRAEQTAC